METKRVVTSAPKLAIVGCGAICEFLYLPSLEMHPDTIGELVLVDTNERRLRTIEKRVSRGRYVKDYHTILGEVDGVIVATPHFSHYDITMDFLRAGAHVLCEKPLALSASDARAMVLQAERSKVTLSVNNTCRLYPSYKAVKELLDHGLFGKIRSMTYLDGESFGWPTVSGFYFDRGFARGVLLDQGAHALDVICWWIGCKPSLTSCQTDSFGGPEAAVSVKFRHESLLGEVRLSWLARLQNRFRIECERGYISGETKDWNNLAVALEGGTPKDRSIKSSANPRQELIDNFLNVIRGNEEPLIPGREVIDSIQFIEECYAGATRFNMPWCNNVERSRT